MEEAIIIGVDLARNVFQLHGAGASGSVVFRKKLYRPRLLSSWRSIRHCTVVMEALAVRVLDGGLSSARA